jgi:hypothetical protein
LPPCRFSARRARFFGRPVEDGNTPRLAPEVDLPQADGTRFNENRANLLFYEDSACCEKVSTGFSQGAR